MNYAGTKTLAQAWQVASRLLPWVGLLDVAVWKAGPAATRCERFPDAAYATLVFSPAGSPPAKQLRIPPPLIN